MFTGFCINVVRDTSLWFIYENSLLTLYFLGYIPTFWALVDNETYLDPRDQLFIPGGYPELQERINNLFTRIGTRFRWLLLKTNSECGGYIIITQWLSINLIRRKLLGFIPTINTYNNYLTFVVDKVGSLIDLGKVYNGHEFHYVSETSKHNSSSQFISRSRYQMLLKGINKNSIEGSYFHNVDVAR
ncbi:Hydrogenobyrinate a,c-diamide synthase [Candidatus Hodgkinia cicadicola]|uniref:Hydrogenobyrinate a,c-diamide synthase n=1 Tax=Candidatus Hodgkinia cicadicola TaxID=573658 RepID=A0ABX4MEY7_9HYPH|nr:Hydrogenobyrinate a,c-diamide synthase [Candidatus Hodgkinia cicadicola]